MRRVLFRVRGIPVHSYPAMLYVGTVCGVVYSHGVARSAGLDAFRVWLATIVLLVVALLGARLLFVATHWAVFRRNLARIWSNDEGGAAQYGGLLAAVPVSWPLLDVLGVPFARFWDVAILTILVAMIFTRVGCLLNGCCAGRPAKTFGVYLSNHLGVWQRRVPTQVLEGGFAAVLLAAATAFWNPQFTPGSLFLAVCGAYAAGRLVLESAREREPGRGAFTVQHAISIVIMGVSLAGLSVLWMA